MPSVSADPDREGDEDIMTEPYGGAWIIEDPDDVLTDKEEGLLKRGLNRILRRKRE